MSEDLISRQGAIDDLDTLWDMTTVDGITASTVLKQVKTDIMNLPSVQERKGRWNRISPAKIYECSVCGRQVMTDDIDVYAFCHGCGAKMEGAEDD